MQLRGLQSSAAAAAKGPALGHMPASDLSKTGSGGPASHRKDPQHNDGEQSETRRGAIINSMAEKSEEESQEVLPDADHPALKYQEAYVEGSRREDDTATAGMPQNRSVPTPEGGLGNAPGHNHPEPARGRTGGLDSVPNELGASPHPHNEDTTRARWSAEEDQPLIRKTGKPDVDPLMQPGAPFEQDRRGTTEPYKEPSVTPDVPYKNPVG